MIRVITGTEEIFYQDYTTLLEEGGDSNDWICKDENGVEHIFKNVVFNPCPEIGVDSNGETRLIIKGSCRKGNLLEIPINIPSKVMVGDNKYVDTTEFVSAI